MRLVTKLLDYLHSAFDKTPDDFVALRVRHVSDGFYWRVSERVLSLYDGDETLATIDLSGYTLMTLVSYLATLSGISVIYMDADRSGLSACALIDGEGHQSRSNGDILRAYQSTLWMFLDALTTELVEAKSRIIDMLDQMSVPTADNEWLDEWGEYFGVPRLIDEVDVNYANRIIAEVTKPRGNNKAIEAALLQRYGQQVDVADIVLWGDPDPRFNGARTFDGSWTYNASATPVYGLFKIIIGYDLLNAGNPPEFIQSVRDFVDGFRDAGTQLDSVQLTTSLISDACPAPADGGIDITVTDQPHFNDLRTFDGSWTYGPAITSESL